MKALILVDIQNDFLPGGTLAVKHGNAIIPLVNSIQSKFDVVVASQDWHPLNHASFANNHENKKVFDVIKLEGQDQVLWPNHCVQGTKGAEFSSELNTHAVSAIFRKGMHKDVDSYSAFFDNNKTQQTGLAAYLKSMEVTNVYVCGLAADYCVYFTAKDAQALGFKTYYITDATRYISEEVYNTAILDLKQHGVIILNSADI
ncbi:bifunctional nicotinamidase/pyrazinamidase [Formosa sp. PL04]|uniref:bifunctional nicotinamidase/pyrazinamidase n=1 Tax=Formosa sp. PL04 TaxID=3081755 RepID=UPI0029828824|nr:bifunctional nicotinamidase/pyrazinamidase [Formosa sp. PL04]MDW5288948.1 bifunctional nicotinamidase/pyrazinamidase [Formosa sp. PL04]